MTLYTTFYDSPIGTIEIKGTDSAITSISFVENIENRSEFLSKPIENCLIQLDEYFKGKRKAFSLPLSTVGTDFQKKTWNALQNIPYGETCSYSGLANEIGNPKAVRAVGSSNGKNKIAILVPCHRVVGKNGNLSGYAWGEWRKEWLLNHEKSFS